MKDPVDVDQLVVDHLDYLYRLAFRLTGCKQTAEDIVQDLFVNLKPRDVDVGYVKNKKAWLGTILYRTFVKHWRKERRYPYAISYDNTDQDDEYESQNYIACQQPGPEELINNTKLQDTLIQALDKLNEEHRTVVIMHDVEGYTLQELHHIMNVPVGTLKSRLHRARNKLQSILSAKKIKNYSKPTLEEYLAHEV